MGKDLAEDKCEKEQSRDIQNWKSSNEFYMAKVDPIIAFDVKARNNMQTPNKNSYMIYTIIVHQRNRHGEVNLWDKKSIQSYGQARK